MAKKKPKAAMDEKKQPVIEPAVELENADMPDSGEISPLEAITEEPEAELVEQADFESGAMEENVEAALLELAVEEALEAEAELVEQTDFENEAIQESDKSPSLEYNAEEPAAEADAVLESEVLQRSDNILPFEPVVEKGALKVEEELESAAIQEHSPAPDALTQEERDKSFIQKMREKYATPNPQKDKEEEKEASPEDSVSK